MASLNISWTPGTGVLSQTIQGLNKTGLPLWFSTGFSPSNPLGPLVGNATLTSASANSVYRFRIQSICPNGENPYSEIVEGISFECVPMEVTEVVDQPASFTVQATLGTSSITKVRFLLYNAAGDTLIQMTPEITVTGSTVSYTFSQPINTFYTLSIVLYSELLINGVITEVVSDLAEDCKQLISTEGQPQEYFARLEYASPPVGDCIVGATSTEFINNNAYIRVYSDFACTTPAVPPSGCEVTFDVEALHTLCVECDPQIVYIDDVSSYSLPLSTGSYQTLVPNGYKYLAFDDWMDCTKNDGGGGGGGCEGGGGLVCAFNIENKKHHIINVLSSGSTPVTIV